MKSGEIPYLVIAGKLDKHLEALQNAVTTRRKFLRDQRAEEMLQQMKMGTKVRLVSVRPRYLNGYEATVVQPRVPRKNGYCKINIDAGGLPRIRRYPTQGLLVPVSTLEIVDD